MTIELANMYTIIFQVILGLLLSYTGLFILSLILKDNSIVDIFWGIGFIQVALHLLIITKNTNFSILLLLVLILTWGVRLSSHIFRKRIKKGGEDVRYAQFRKTWKNFYIRSIFQVYLLQCVLLVIISLPIVILFLYSTQDNMLLSFSIIGFCTAVFGLTFEIISDRQLHEFISNTKSKGKLMTKGLWKYSRHPNYFGESVFWLGICIIALPYSVFSILSWLCITILLRFVSGVPMAESRYQLREDFKEYSKITPAFIPNFLIK